MYIVLKAVEWTFLKEPLKRVKPSTNKSSKKSPNVDIKHVLIDATDLITNARGYGWTWSHKTTFLPWKSRPTIRELLWRLLYRFTFYDIMLWSIEHFFPELQGTAGMSIFN